MIKILITCLLFLLSVHLHAGNELQLLREGNSFFEEGRYVEAEDRYRQTLELNSRNYKALHNLGNALYHQGRLEEAAKVYQQLLALSPSDDTRAAGWHNLGNSLLGKGEIAESIEAYKNALRLAPMDDDTRYNLAYAFKLLEEMPHGGESQTDSGDGENGEGEQQQPPDDGDDEQKQESQSSAGDDQDDREQSMPERPEQLTPEDAERILEALGQQEQKVQEKINRESQSTEPVRTEREW